MKRILGLVLVLGSLVISAPVFADMGRVSKNDTATKVEKPSSTQTTVKNTTTEKNSVASTK